MFNITHFVFAGNSHIHDMSTYGSHELSIVLVSSTGEKAYANYSKFSVEDEQSNYLLHVTGYSGTISCKYSSV